MIWHHTYIKTKVVSRKHTLPCVLANHHFPSKEHSTFLIYVYNMPCCNLRLQKQRSCFCMCPTAPPKPTPPHRGDGSAFLWAARWPLALVHIYLNSKDGPHHSPVQADIVQKLMFHVGLREYVFNQVPEDDPELAGQLWVNVHTSTKTLSWKLDIY
jgi:hypothetical protein